MSRRLALVVALAAVAALLAGAAVGRNLLLSPAARVADVVVFKDGVSKTSLAYPATWTRLPIPPGDPEVALRVASGTAMSLLVRVTRVGLAKVTTRTLPIVRKLTDDLVAADPRSVQLSAPEAVTVGGLPGYRYRYRFGEGSESGAHVHYFLFKGDQMIQLVLQALPAERLRQVEPVFDHIVSTFRG